MKKMSIYVEIRDENDHSRVIEKVTLRVVNLNPDFVGFGENGAINKEEFNKLANALEPGNHGWSLS